MKKAAIILVGLWFFYIIIVLVPDRMLLEQSRQMKGGSIGRVGAVSADPKVMLWFESPPDDQASYHTLETLRIVLRGPIVTVEDKVIPINELTAFINQQISVKQFRYVMLTPEECSTMQEVLSALDACRKSQIHAVLLNFYAVPRNG